MLEFIYSHITVQTLVWLIVALPLCGAILNGSIAMLTARREVEGTRKIVNFIGVLFPVLSFLAVAVCSFTLIGFEDASPSLITGPLFQWTAIPGLTIDIGLNVDQLSLVMGLVVTGVGSLIHLYSVGYMSHDAGFAR